MKNLTCIYDTTVLNYFLEFEPGQRRKIMIAHYFVFMIPVIESMYLWIRFFMARWVVSHGRLANDVLILYRVKEAASGKHNNRASKNIRSIADMVTIWFIVRFGYHFPTYFLVQKVTSVIIVNLLLVDKLKPGMKKMYTVDSTSTNEDIIPGIIHMPTLWQWHVTLDILLFAAAIPFYGYIVVLNPNTNIQQLVFLAIPAGTLGIWLWKMCTHYMDTYVQLEKI